MDIIDFFITYLDDFDPSKYNIKDDFNKPRIHIRGQRQSGTSTSMILTALYKVLTTDEPLDVFISSFNHRSSYILIDMFKQFHHSLVSAGIPNDINLNNKGMIKFNNGSSVQIIPTYFSDCLRGRSNSVLVLIDDFNLTVPSRISMIESEIKQYSISGKSIQMICSN